MSSTPASAACRWTCPGAISRPSSRAGSSRVRATGTRRSGTARAASSPGSRPAPTRCTSVCCSRGTAVTRRATSATVPGSRTRRCSGDLVTTTMRRASSSRPRAFGPASRLERAVRGAAGALCARSHAAADRAGATILQRLSLPAPFDEAADLLLDEVRARLDFSAASASIPDARPAVADPFRRRSAAHQPDDRARHVAGQYAVRARRAVDRPASARHATRHRGHATPARQRQLAARRRARPADHARRGSYPRPRAWSG